MAQLPPTQAYANLKAAHDSLRAADSTNIVARIKAYVLALSQMFGLPE